VGKKQCGRRGVGSFVDKHERPQMGTQCSALGGNKDKKKKLEARSRQGHHLLWWLSLLGALRGRSIPHIEVGGCVLGRKE